MKFRSHILTIVLTASPAQGALVAVSGYVYATTAESQPQPTSFQGGAISDVGNVKLTDGVLATGSWNDGKNVGFRNSGGDSGNPQPRVTFDLGVLHAVSTVDIWTVIAFNAGNESASISSSVDGVTFSSPVTVDPIIWTGGFANANLERGSIDVSSLPDGRFYRVDIFDPAEWVMINEIQFDGTAVVPEPSAAILLGLGALVLGRRRRA